MSKVLCTQAIEPHRDRTSQPYEGLYDEVIGCRPRRFINTEYNRREASGRLRLMLLRQRMVGMMRGRPCHAAWVS